ncbi:MAG: hypothetical protein HOP34_00420 [Methylococcaceae bacterium]|nr:hypothetical protein [Methylococcaceae bacterium]
MNHKPQPALIALVLLSTGLLASQVHAHGVTNQPLGAAVGATDYYQVKCANTGTGNAARLEVQIRDDTAGAALLSAQVQKGLFAVNTTDPTGGDDNYSPLVAVAGGNGIYDVTVNKTTATGRQYDLEYHCITKNNAHAGTTISQKQNQ